MGLSMLVRIVIGLFLTAAALAIAGRRLWWLRRLAMSGQPAPERFAAVRGHPGRDVATETVEVIGQRKLLKWTVPGVAHALTFWGFTVLLLTIIEAYGDLFSRTFAIPRIGHWAFTGFIEDLFAVAVLAGIITFAVIRLRRRPAPRGPRLAVFRLAHGRGVAGTRDDLAGDRDAAAVPGRAGQHGRVSLRPRRVRLRRSWGTGWRRSGPG